jgi:CBS domain-containing protein
MLAKDLMTSAPVSVQPETFIGKAIDLMLQHGVSGLPVLDDAGRICGILTEGDLLEQSAVNAPRPAPEQHDEAFFRSYLVTHGRTVGDCMTHKVVTAGPDMPLFNLVALMRNNKIKRLPVVERGRLVGIVSRRDVIRAISTGRDRTAQGDDALRLAVVTRLRSELGLGTDQVDVQVRDAKVVVTGDLALPTQQRAVRLVAESVAGVAGVVITQSPAAVAEHAELSAID